MKYDLIVIGAGPGGYVSAIRAAQLGKNVALVEKDRAGGTCLNRGCIPTKALMHSAEIIREIKSAEEYGIGVSDVKVDFERLHARKAEVVNQLVGGIEGLIVANKIDFYKGSAKVVGANHVFISERDESESDDVTLEGDYIILATGSRPLIPPIPGLDLNGVVTSDDILKDNGLETDSLIIIGGGVIGMEIASIYNALGTEVSVIEAQDRILPTLDKEISQNLSMIMKKRGVAINTGAMVESIVESAAAGSSATSQDVDEGGAPTGGQTGKLSVHYEAKGEKKTLSADNVLVCIGRRPNTEGLLADELVGEGKIALERGFVHGDESGRTGISNIYAIGDILFGGIQLAHAASAEGVNAVEDMFDVHHGTKIIEAVPSGIYTDPEIASIGMTEAEVRAQGIEYSVGKAMTGSNGKTLIESGERGYVKLIFSKDEGVLLGAQMVCKRATDMIGALAVGFCSRATKEELEGVIWPHPTFSEVIGEAIEDAGGGAIHAMPKRKGK